MIAQKENTIYLISSLFESKWNYEKYEEAAVVEEQVVQKQNNISSLHVVSFKIIYMSYEQWYWFIMFSLSRID